MHLRENLIKESICKYGTQTVIDTDLLYSVLCPIDSEKINNLLTKYNIAEISVMTATQLENEEFYDYEAIKIMAMFELARRLESFTGKKKTKITNPKDVYTYMHPRYRETKKEIVYCLMLDTKNQIIREEIISIGDLNSSIVRPREVFKPAIEVSANGIIVTHNHPSGDPTPSREDVLITEKLKEAGKILGIDFLDQIIIGEGSYKSMKEEGFLH
jgi:DNA repair protein RadC